MKHLHYQTHDTATLKLRNLKPGNRVVVRVLKRPARERHPGKRRHLLVSLPDAVEIVIDDSRSR